MIVVANVATATPAQGIICKSKNPLSDNLMLERKSSSAANCRTIPAIAQSKWCLEFGKNGKMASSKIPIVAVTA